jgi:hypothetical protein
MSCCKAALTKLSSGFDTQVSIGNVTEGNAASRELVGFDTGEPFRRRCYKGPFRRRYYKGDHQSRRSLAVQAQTDCPSYPRGTPCMKQGAMPKAGLTRKSRKKTTS